MEKPYFPLFIDISDMKIVVIGGGNIATRRVETLVKFASDITVIAPKITPKLQTLEEQKGISCIYREYHEDDILMADMVLAVTDQKEVNNRIAEECKKLKIKDAKDMLLNVADDRSLCDFYFPAVVVKEEVVIGINSSGKNPGKVKKIREELGKE